jgi:hypothetical protein
VGVKKKKAKPSPKGGKLHAQVKKAKRSSVVKKLLAQAKSVVKGALKHTLFDHQAEALKQMESLPQIDVPVTSTEVGSGPPKKLTIPMGAKSKEFVDKLKAASAEIHKNTHRKVHIVGTPLSSDPVSAFKKWQEHIQSKQGVVQVEDVKNPKFTEIAGVLTLHGQAEIADSASTGSPHPVGAVPPGAQGSMYDALTDPKTPEADIQAYETTMAKGAMPESFMAGDWHAVMKARKDADEHYKLMKDALAGTLGSITFPLIPKRQLGEKAVAYRSRRTIGAAMTMEEAVKKGLLLGFKADEFKFDPAEVYPYQPLYTTPPIIPVGKDVIAEVDDKLKKLVGFKASDFVDALGQPLYPGLKAQEAALTEWINNAVKCAIHVYQFDQFDEMSLLKIRGMIDHHYDDTVFSGGVGPPALSKELGKQVVMYRAGQRLRHELEAHHEKFDQAQIEMFNKVFPSEGLPVTFNGPDKIITKQDIANWMTSVAQIIFDFIHWQHPCKEVLLEVRKYIEQVYDEDFMSKLPLAYIADKMIPKAGVVHRVGVRVRHMLIEKYGELPDEADDLFAEVFPLPNPADAAAVGMFTDLMAPIAGPQAPTFVKSLDELKAAFGEPDMDNAQAKLVATLLKNTQEHMEAHPEAQGVGPLDGAGIVQTLAPFSAVPNGNGNVYSGDLWDKMVKDTVEQIKADSPDPGAIPQMDVKLVIGEDGNPYMEKWLAGELIEKKPVSTALTQKGFDTLNRFGVVLKETG